MPLTKTIQAVLVDKVPKIFADGTTGYYCTVLLPDESLLSFWAPEEQGDQLGDAENVEAFADGTPCKLLLNVKYWEGKKKYTLAANL